MPSLWQLWATLSEITDSAYAFHVVLCCLYLASACASWIQHRYDSYFDSHFAAKEVYGFRIFTSTLLIALTLISIGELLAYARSAQDMTLLVRLSVLILVGVAGFFADALSSIGPIVASTVSKQHLVVVWIGISSAGLLCIVTAYALGFNPDASATVIRFFFLIASVLVMMCMLVLGLIHLGGEIDTFYESATREGELLLGEVKDEAFAMSAWIQGTNAFITTFCFPLLPLLCSSVLSQELVLWKFSMDFVAPSMLLIHCPFCSLTSLGVLSSLRVVLLGTSLWCMHSLTRPGCSVVENTNSSHWLLIGSWDAMMLLGAFISCLTDISSSTETHDGVSSLNRQQWLRKNRFAHHAGICIALVTSGIGMHLLGGSAEYSAPGESLFPACVKPGLSHATLTETPCGGKSSEQTSTIFSYGANMGCKKLSATEVYPQSAQAAFVLGYCLRFGAAEDVPTSLAEPAFGNLVPCKEGCVHGVLHRIPLSQISKLNATEPGYKLVELPEVVNYYGMRFTGVKAYVMHHYMTALATSRRYAGLVYCNARARLTPAYAEQLAGTLKKQGIQDLQCLAEDFNPLANQSHLLSVQRIFPWSGITSQH